MPRTRRSFREHGRELHRAARFEPASTMIAEPANWPVPPKSEFFFPAKSTTSPNMEPERSPRFTIELAVGRPVGRAIETPT